LVRGQKTVDRGQTNNGFCLLSSVFCLRRIVPPGIKGVAAANSPDALGDSAPRAVLADGQNHVLAAPGLVDTRWRQNRTYQALVKADKANHRRGEQAADHGVSPARFIVSASLRIFRITCFVNLASE